MDSIYMEDLKSRLCQIFEEAFEDGHNIESDLDRDLFAEFLINKGIRLVDGETAESIA